MWFFSCSRDQCPGSWTHSRTYISAGIADPGYSGVDKIFTDRRIHRAPDCAITCREGICLTVLLSPPVTLSDANKLNALRRLDQFRQWHSLDEKRYCLVCGEMISGREIQVIGGTRGNGPLRIICPTEHCNAMPMEWVRPADEVLIKIAMAEAERHRICLIIRAGRATRSLPKKNDKRLISRTRPKPRLG
jgi:hypothetical protein